MPSVGPLSAGLKNVNTNPYFLVVANIAPSSFFTYNGPSGSGGSFGPVSNTNFTPYNFYGDLTSSGTVPANTSSLLFAGNMLRDMGKTVVTPGSTFRKVQLLASSVVAGPNTTGITGVQGQRTGYLTGYILMGTDTNQSGFDSVVARVVRLY
jgi:hypothetical protein